MGWVLLIVVLGIMGFAPARRALISGPVFLIVKRLKIFPHISRTELTAIEAGQTGIEREFFQTRLKLPTLRAYAEPNLTAAERAFLDGPVTQLCQMSDDWSIWEKGDLPEEIWKYLRKHKFFGIIIPQSYGGLGFSRIAHSEIILKLSSRSIPVAITAMVPNSLGPAELLLAYGTKKQQDRYLPRLARGDDIPCFALTEPEAGSDASSLRSEGVVFQEGDEIKIRLNWEKRWITLGSVATIIGIAFRLRDPDLLLGLGSEDIGITCALIDAKTPGISRERRFDPLGVPFVNSHLTGKNVVISLSHVIGERSGLGRGWMMLTASLAAGRGISLPAQSTGLMKRALAVTSAHAAIRFQFGLPLTRFQGVREPLGRIAGLVFIMDATRKMAISVMEEGGTLPVIASVAKYNLTELGRIGANDAMDIMGGTGISLGPHNQIAHGYIAAPIGITVEGANILTRTLMIFGQGAFRCHPFAFPLMKSVMDHDKTEFDRNLIGWLGHGCYTFAKASAYYLIRGPRFLRIKDRHLRRSYRLLLWASAEFSFMTDAAMLLYGGQLKAKEHITGRYADILSWLFINWSVIRYFEQNPKSDNLREVFNWTMSYGFRRIQLALEGLYAQMGGPFTRWIWRYVALPLARLNPYSLGPSDRLTDQVCDALEDPEVRNELTQGIYNAPHDDAHARLEEAYQAVRSVDTLYDTLRNARRSLPESDDLLDLINFAHERGILDPKQTELIEKVERLRRHALEVDMTRGNPFSPHKAYDHDHPDRNLPVVG